MTGHETLKQAGLKATAPRLKVLDILEGSERHLSADDIYRRLMDGGERIGLATVYRVLSQLEGAGLVRRHHFEDAQAVFELAGEQPHDHLVCVECGAIREFHDEVIQNRQRAIAKQLGFEVDDHKLVLYARCREFGAPAGCRGEQEEDDA